MEREVVEIHRSRQADNFTVVPNALIRDTRLSRFARHMLIEILANGADWHVTADGLWQAAAASRPGARGEGRDVYRRAFRELQDAGYLIRVKVQVAGGQWVTHLDFYDTPQDDVPPGHADDGDSVPGATSQDTLFAGQTDACDSVPGATSINEVPAGQADDWKPADASQISAGASQNPGAENQHPATRNQASSKRTTSTSREVTTPPTPPPARADRQRGTRLPEDFAVTAEMVAWCRLECPGVDGRRETERFCDHFWSKPGKDGRKLDWVRTWKNWMRTAQDRVPHSRSAPALALPAPEQRRSEVARLREEEHLRADGISPEKIIRGSLIA